MDELELERMQLEKIRVGAARAEMEFNVKQRQLDIKRLQDTIKIQLAKEAELDTKLAALAGKDS